MTQPIEMDEEEMEEAIETAAYALNKKQTKKQAKKHCHLFKTTSPKTSPNGSPQDTNFLGVGGPGCKCGGLHVELQEGMESTVMKSPRMNRKSMRREGVAEKNETERKLVKETIKVILKGSNIDEYNF